MEWIPDCLGLLSAPPILSLYGAFNLFPLDPFLYTYFGLFAGFSISLFWDTSS